MRRALILLVGLTLLAQAVAARAADAPPAAPAAPAATVAPAPVAPPVAETPAVAAATTPTPPSRRFQVALLFLPMPMGEQIAVQGGQTFTSESRFAFGAGLSLGFEVLPGLVVGVAPQIITGSKPREAPETAGNEYDLMARVAYRYAIPGVAAVYAELLPGYSMYYPVKTDSSKGFVLAGGVGCEIDLSERMFAVAGVGYQRGWQSQTAVSDYQTSYVRVALGVGARF